MKITMKDWTIINIFPTIVRILHLLGFSYEKLGDISKLTASSMLVQAKNLSKINIEKNNAPQNIYVLEMVSGSTFHLFIEGLIALGLKKKGHKVTIILDHNFLPIHELKKAGKEDVWDYKANRAFVYASKFLTNLGIDYTTIEDFIGGESKISKYDFKYASILEATLLKHYKVGVISDDLPSLQSKKELIKKAIGISDAVGKKLVKINPDSVIMSHGIYSTWGPVFNVLDENNIPVLVHGRGKKRHSQVFNWNKTGDSWDVSDEWDRLKDKDLTKEELNEIHDYLDSRISHKDDVFVYNFGSKTEDNETIKYLGLDKDKPIYTLFTNVLWDAASAQREIVFNNPVEWVIETIKWFNEQTDKQLIVKIHPAEVVIGTNMPFYDIIIERVTPNKNVRIIKPKEKVNSWSIYDISTLGIVHTTTAGMEMPLVNKPCMVVSKTHYRSKGFTIDVNSKEEYYDLLKNFDSSKIDYIKNKEKALKYAYLLFMRYQVSFNFFFEEVSTQIKGFRYDTFERYMESKDFTKIIDNIENRNHIFDK